MKQKEQFINTLFMGILLVTAMITSARAEPVTLNSGVQQNTLLELFTSEGCSSCPPADRWLSGLKDDSRLWQDVIPLAFHVDYWDYIGWPDRFATAAYGERQRLHAVNWGNGRVYTPGLVQNGNEWDGWFSNRTLNLNNDNVVGDLQLSIADQHCQAQFNPQIALSKPLRLHIAVLGFDLSTVVKAGENHGRTLNHDFVVLGYTSLPFEAASQGYLAQTDLPPTRVNAERRAVAAWVSTMRDPRPLQAVGGWL